MRTILYNRKLVCSGDHRPRTFLESYVSQKIDLKHQIHLDPPRAATVDPPMCLVELHLEFGRFWEHNKRLQAVC